MRVLVALAALGWVIWLNKKIEEDRAENRRLLKEAMERVQKVSAVLAFPKRVARSL